MAKFTGGAVPLIVRLHDISTHSGLLHHINISYTGTQSHTVQAVGAQTQMYVLQSNNIWSKMCGFWACFCNFISENVRKHCIPEVHQFWPMQAYKHICVQVHKPARKLQLLSVWKLHAVALNYLKITWCCSLHNPPVQLTVMLFIN